MSRWIVVVGVLLLLGALLALWTGAQYLRPGDVNALPSKPADERFVYGNDPQQFAELRLPKGPGPHPVVIVIHGGCWLAQLADLKNTAALADALRDAGVATWNIEYRRADSAGGGWPGTFQDAARAADYLQEIATKYNLDLTRVVTTGHSAGGHLALWLAARPRIPAGSTLYSAKPLPIRGVVMLGGIGDLNKWADHGAQVCGDDGVRKLMGGPAAKWPERYKQASPIEMLPLGVPQIFITGEHDGVVPPQFADAYAAVARQKGDKVEHIVVEQAAHHEYNSPSAVTWTTVRDSILSLAKPEKPKK